MNEHSKLTNAPVEVPLGPITLKMSPLTDRDMAELDEWVRGQYIRNARASAQGLSDSDWRRTMQTAMDYAMTISWCRLPGSRLMATPDGLARLAWQGCRKHMPELKTYEDLREQLFDPRNVELFNEFFAKINAVPEPPAGVAAPANPLAEPSSMAASPA